MTLHYLCTICSLEFKKIQKYYKILYKIIKKMLEKYYIESLKIFNCKIRVEFESTLFNTLFIFT